jgi:hydroxymethylbilane synthase
MEILGLTDRIAQHLPVEEFVPAPGQGCVAVECRDGDDATASLLAAVDHAPSRIAVEAERAFLAELGTGCSLPVAAHAVGGTLLGFLADPESGRHVRGEAPLAEAAALARRLHRQLGTELGPESGPA